MQATTNQMEALERIVIAVRHFRQAPQNMGKPAYSPELSAFLKRHLPAQDWALWHALQIDWEKCLTALPD